MPRLDGGELALEDLRGNKVLLVFSDPHCGPCQTLARRLERLHREQPELRVVMISRGEPRDNRAKAKQHKLTFPIVLQQQWEMSRRYGMFATPIGYLIDDNGVIVHDVAAGEEAVVRLAGHVGNGAVESLSNETARDENAMSPAKSDLF